jgi:vancomycin resistance protein YoaR
LPRRRRSPFRTFGEWLLLVLALLAILAAVAGMLLLYSERDFSHRIYPNVGIRGVAVGAQTPGSAERRLEQHYAAFLSYPVELHYAGRVWQPTLKQLGAELDFAAALEQAYTIGRTDTRADNLRTVAATWEHGVELPLHLRIDQTVMQRYLLSLTREVERAPRNAELQLAGTEVTLLPDATGTQLLVDETLVEITSALQSLEPQVVALRTRELPPRLVAADLEPTIAEIRRALAGPIVLATDEQKWQWEVEEIAAWLTLHENRSADGLPEYELDIDTAAIRSALAPIAAELRREGTLPRVNWNDGNMQIIAPGEPGQGLNVNAAFAAVNAALQGAEREIGLQVMPTDPPVIQSNLASLGIVEPIATGVSSFSRSQAYRITNIRAGARRMHGILVPPGSEFSFNNNLGAVDASNGFVQGSAIVDNRTQKEWGGGLCQVSTTMFRAAFWAGLPITERHEHAFRIGWYEELGEPPGFDAAIFTPWTDLRFRNDTGGWILIQTWADTNRQRLYITLYGAPSAREVTMDYRILKHLPRPRKSLTVEDPNLPRGTFKRTDYARGGLEMELYRTVYEDGVVRSRDVFPTVFQPWPNIYVRGTG